MKRFLAALFAILSSSGSFAAQPVTSPTGGPLTLDDLYSDPTIADAAISPSGRYIVAVVSRPDSDMLVLMDLEQGSRRVISNIGHDVAGKKLDAHIIAVYWKTEDRILFRVAITPDDETRFGRASEQTILKLGHRLFAIGRDGGNLRRLLGDNAEAALDGSLNLGRIASLLLGDPEHVLLVVEGFDGISLFHTNVNTGHGELVEKPRPQTWGWWLDVNGNAALRTEISNGTVRVLKRDGPNEWKKVLSYRQRDADERPDLEFAGPSDQAGKFYVLARPPGRDRRGLYLYDVEKQAFGEPLVEHPQYDLVSARISRDGTRVRAYCYVADVGVCEFPNSKLNAHLKGIRKFFKETANVAVHDSTEDDSTILLYVDGPSDPPSYYYYRIAQARIEPVGMKRERMAGRPMPTATVVRWKSTDGREFTGYLTRPPGAANATKLPLVVMPHGGPEARDQLAFNRWVQFLAGRGYAVFQPNFRGSEGFGLAFSESGYGEWGRKMQDDINTGVDALVNDGSADAARVCIMGASYGGYAALAGATLTPDKYRCAISIAGISDLATLIAYKHLGWETGSEAYKNLLRRIGDPGQDEARLAAVSPAKLASQVKAPILLIHGERDGVVPISQSERMKKALDKAGRTSEFVRLYDEGHSGWDDDVEQDVLAGVGEFLKKHLGPGVEFR